MIKKFIKSYSFCFLAALLGLAGFLFIFGLEPLRITGDAWILKGYGGDDIVQHYTGWMFFRNSPWSFPLGKALDLGYPLGTNISYTDSLPIVSIFFKLFRNILPKTFQFFGIYTALCFMLQGIFSSALIYRFTGSKPFAAGGSLFFIFSTSFIERAFRQAALDSHWILLAALCLYFDSSKNQKKQLWGWILVNCIALGIHPYLFPMVFSVFLCKEITTFQRSHSWKNFLKDFTICLSAVMLWGLLIGVWNFSTKIEPESGFGLYSLNLNGAINPQVKGIRLWSRFFKILPLFLEQQDDCYYLGAGIILGLIFCLLFWIFRSFFRKDTHTALENRSAERFSINVISILSILLTVYALSNRITWGNRSIFTVPLPQSWYRYLNIFRASGRFFFIPYYLIILFVAVNLWKIPHRKWIRFVLLILFAGIQITDIFPGLNTIRKSFDHREEYPEISQEWNIIAESHQKIMAFEPLTNRTLSFLIAKDRLKTNIENTAPIHLKAYITETKPERDALFNRLLNGEELDPDTAYCITEEPFLYFQSQAEMDAFKQKLQENYRNKADFQRIPIGTKNYLFLIPNP